MKYHLPPFVNTSFISHKLEWINSKGAKLLASAALWGLRVCFDSTHTWHLEFLTKVNFGIKLKLAKHIIQPKLTWQFLKCQTFDSSTLITLFATLFPTSYKEKRNKPPLSLPFPIKVPNLEKIHLLDSKTNLKLSLHSREPLTRLFLMVGTCCTFFSCMVFLEVNFTFTIPTARTRACHPFLINKE